jgi:hydrogenase expression/formation protein HypC
MCLAIPGRIATIEGMTATVDFGGVRRLVQIQLLPEVRTGDHVLVHAGFAIQRLEEDEASEILSLFEQSEHLLEESGQARKP